MDQTRHLTTNTQFVTSQCHGIGWRSSHWGRLVYGWQVIKNADDYQVYPKLGFTIYIKFYNVG